MSISSDFLLNSTGGSGVWLQDVCVKKDFDELYNKLGDEGRELKVIHGGVVEVTYQPVPSTRDITLQEFPFGAPPPPPPPPEQPEVPAEHEEPAPVQEPTQVCSSRFRA